MSQAINGSAKAEINPIPDKALLHFVALLSNGEEALGKFLKSLEARSASMGPVQLGTWHALDRPRPCTYTDLKIGPWEFRLLFDPEGLPATLQSMVFPEEPSLETKEIVDQHRGCCLVFLTASPDAARSASQAEPEGWFRFRHLAQLTWAWLDAGAELLCFPEGRVYLPRRLLLPLEPDEMTPEHAYLFLSNGVAYSYQQKGQQCVWVRSWGLGQFGLPDLAAHLTMGGPTDQLEVTMESLRLLMETLPPAMIRDHGILPEGGCVQVGHIQWKAVTPPRPATPDSAFLASRFGVQIFEQTQD